MHFTLKPTGKRNDRTRASSVISDITTITYRVTKSPLAEFAYNNSVHGTTGMSPFFAMYGFHPNVPSSGGDDRPEEEVPVARKRAEEFENEGKELAERWRCAVEFQKKWYDNIVRHVEICKNWI